MTGRRPKRKTNFKTDAPEGGPGFPTAEDRQPEKRRRGAPKRGAKRKNINTKKKKANEIKLRGERGKQDVKPSVLIKVKKTNLKKKRNRKKKGKKRPYPKEEERSSNEAKH